MLNADPRVRMSLVRPKRNPITGAIVIAEVVLEDSCGPALDAPAAENLKNDLLEACRRALPAHKVPARLSFVPSLKLTAAGKLGAAAGVRLNTSRSNVLITGGSRGLGLGMARLLVGERLSRDRGRPQEER